MYESLIKKLRFEIGEQYELHEFNLKYVSSTFENNLRFEKYEFLQENSFSLFGIELTNQVLLNYNADILHSIEYNVHKENLPSFLSTLQKFLQNDNSEKYLDLHIGITISLNDSTKIRLKIFVEEDVKFIVMKV
jgi:hypothetical protein